LTLKKQTKNYKKLVERPLQLTGEVHEGCSSVDHFHVALWIQARDAARVAINSRKPCVLKFKIKYYTRKSEIRNFETHVHRLAQWFAFINSS
jgi:predicted component of type VI protein secretion system